MVGPWALDTTCMMPSFSSAALKTDFEKVRIQRLLFEEYGGGQQIYSQYPRTLFLVSVSRGFLRYTRRLPFFGAQQ